MSREAIADLPPPAGAAPRQGPVVLGFLMALGFVALSAGRDVLAVQVARDPDIPFYFDLAIGFFPAALLAASSVLAVPSFRPTPKEGGHALRYVALINVTSLVNWLLYFVSLSKIGAVLFAAIVVGCMPISLLVLMRFGGRLIRRQDLLAALLVLGGVGVLSADQLHGLPTAAGVGDQVLGIALALLTSFSSAANNLLVGRLKGCGYGTVAIFAVRFWLLLAVAALLGATVLFSDLPRDPAVWAGLSLFGLVGVALPLLSLQGAIVRLGPERPTLMIALHPLTVFLLQLLGWWLGSQQFPGWWGVVGLPLVTLGIAWGLVGLRPKGR